MTNQLKQYLHLVLGRVTYVYVLGSVSSMVQFIVYCLFIAYYLLIILLYHNIEQTQYFVLVQPNLT